MRLEIKDKLEEKFENLKPLGVGNNQFLDALLDNYRDSQMTAKPAPVKEKIPVKKEIEPAEKQYQLYLNNLYYVFRQAMIDAFNHVFGEEEKKVEKKETPRGDLVID